MWLFTKYGFFSAVQAKAGNGKSRTPDPGKVMVRARREEHLKALLERFRPFDMVMGVRIRHTADTDYAYRIILPVAVWSEMCAILADECGEYANFKDEVKHTLGAVDSDYLAALHAIWSVMYRTQEDISSAPIDRTYKTYKNDARRYPGL